MHEIQSTDFKQLNHRQTQSNENVLTSRSKDYHLDHEKQLELCL